MINNRQLQNRYPLYSVHYQETLNMLKMALTKPEMKCTLQNIKTMSAQYEVCVFC